MKKLKGFPRNMLFFGNYAYKMGNIYIGQVLNFNRQNNQREIQLMLNKFTKKIWNTPDNPETSPRF